LVRRTCGADPNRIGDENKGWTYAKFLLGHERTNIAGIGGAKRELARLKRIAASETKHGRPLIEDPLFAAHIAQVEVDLWALEITNLRVLSASAVRVRQDLRRRSSRIRGTEIAQPHFRAHDARGRSLCAAISPRSDGSRLAVGPAREAPGPSMPRLGRCLYESAETVHFGGTNEIQKNIISKMIVGL